MTSTPQQPTPAQVLMDVKVHAEGMAVLARHTLRSAEAALRNAQAAYDEAKRNSDRADEQVKVIHTLLDAIQEAQP